MERIEGQNLGAILESADTDTGDQMVRNLAALLVKIHTLTVSPKAAEGLPAVSVDARLHRARQMLSELGAFQFGPILDWLLSRRRTMRLLPPSLTHRDVHPWNVLQEPGGRMVLIDWPAAAISDFRFDLGWLMMAMEVHFGSRMTHLVLREYEAGRGAMVPDLDFFQAASYAGRLVDFVMLRDSVGPVAETVKVMNVRVPPEIAAQRLFELTGIALFPPVGSAMIQARGEAS